MTQDLNSRNSVRPAKGKMWVYLKRSTMMVLGKIILAIVILFLLFAPYSHPDILLKHQGFDENLVAINPRGYLDNSGIVTLNSFSLNITGLPNSQPTVHVVSSMFSYSSEFDVEVIREKNPLLNWTYVSKAAEAPRDAKYARILLSVDLDTRLLFDDIEFKSITQTLEITEGFEQGFSGWKAGSDSNKIISGECHNGTYSLAINKVTAQNEYDVVSPTFALPSDRQYRIGGWIKYLKGLGPFKITVEWLDENYLHISYSADWESWSYVVVKNFPVQIKLWSPRTNDMFAIWYTSTPDNRVFTGISTRTSSGETQWNETNYVTHYSLGQSYHYKIEFRKGSYIKATISNSTWHYLYAVNSNSFSSIFDEDRLALTFFASVYNGSSLSSFRNLVVTTPSDNPYVSFASDQWLPIIYSVVIAGAVILYGKDIYALGKRAFLLVPKFFKNKRSMNKRNYKVFLTMIVVFLVSLPLFFLGNHPFDIYSEKAWIYITARYGLRSLYPLSFITTAAPAFGGDPYMEAAFPYPPLIGYFFYSIGAFHNAFLSGFSLRSFSLEFMIKLLNLIFVLLTGLLLYVTSRKIEGNGTFAFSSMRWWVMNPAVLFNVAVWGETDGILAFFLLSAAVSLEFDKSTLAWILMGVSILTKQMTLIPVLFMAIIALKRNGIRKTILDASVGVTVAFITVLPYFLLGYSPTLIVDPTLRKALEASTVSFSEKVMSIVSRDACSIWPLATFFEGQKGGDRFTYSDLALVSNLGVNYLNLGLILFGACATALVLLVAFSKRTALKKHYFFAILTGSTLASLLLPTRVANRYFLFAILFLILSRKRLGTSLHRFALGIISVTTFASMYGTLLSISLAHPDLLPYFAPSRNFLNKLFLECYRSFPGILDTVITVGCLLNLCVLAITLKSSFSSLRERLKRRREDHENKDILVQIS